MTEATATSAACDAARIEEISTRRVPITDLFWHAFLDARFKRTGLIAITGQPCRVGQMADRSIWICIAPSHGCSNVSFEFICTVDGDDYVRCSCGYLDGVVRYSCRHIRALWVKGYLRRSEIKPTWELSRRDRLAWEEQPDA